jgi:hypothetical protein
VSLKIKVLNFFLELSSIGGGWNFVPLIINVLGLFLELCPDSRGLERFTKVGENRNGIMNFHPYSTKLKESNIEGCRCLESEYGSPSVFSLNL